MVVPMTLALRGIWRQADHWCFSGPQSSPRFRKRWRVIEQGIRCPLASTSVSRHMYPHIAVCTSCAFLYTQEVDLTITRLVL